jgi:FKBP-type peptidyl-prolyl cis-trans isomerase
MRRKSCYRYSFLSLLLCSAAAAWQQQPPPFQSQRRAILEGMLATTAVVVVGVVMVPQAQAQPSEFQSIGTQAPLPLGSQQETPFSTLPNGVKVKDFSIGTGSETVGPTSRVSVQCSGRLLNLNGVIFYNTKNNNDPDGFGAVPLTFGMGKGEALPGLEAGLLGMRKNGIRRIIVPAELAYSQYPDLEPKPMTVLDQRALDSVVKNPRRDATILFDVRLERFK